MFYNFNKVIRYRAFFHVVVGYKYPKRKFYNFLKKKQPLEVSDRKRCFLTFCKIHRKTLVPKSLFLKNQGSNCAQIFYRITIWKDLENSGKYILGGLFVFNKITDCLLGQNSIKAITHNGCFPENFPNFFTWQLYLKSPFSRSFRNFLKLRQVLKFSFYSNKSYLGPCQVSTMELSSQILDGVVNAPKYLEYPSQEHIMPLLTSKHLLFSQIL